jgi:hypothetical protein
MTPRRWKKTIEVTSEQHDALWSAINHLDNEQAGREDEVGQRMRREYKSLQRLYEKLSPK